MFEKIKCWLGLHDWTTYSVETKVTVAGRDLDVGTIDLPIFSVCKDCKQFAIGRGAFHFKFTDEFADYIKNRALEVMEEHK